jgi:biotin carboxyl carrier protein
LRFHYRTGDRDVQLNIIHRGDAYAVTLDGQELDLEVLSAQPGELQLRCGERRSRAYVAARGDDRFVFLEGRVFNFRRPADIHELEEENGTSGPHIVAQMPCTIVKLLVEPGQEVVEGDGLLIIESMKMETEITAPLTGSVVAVHVRQGETVGMRASLVDLEPALPANDA